jgi:tRNA/rRNA methyltransferase
MSGIAFVLHRPARGGNIGAAARALKTMGFSDLRIVGGEATTSAEAIAFAHGARDVLDGARRYDTLESALTGIDLVVGTSARRRGDRRDFLAPDELYTKLSTAPNSGTTAIVFGPEEHGLTNDELSMCQIISAVPMRGRYPSLNLAQAVMVYCYALSPLVLRNTRRKERVPDEMSVRRLHQRAQRLLPRLGFDSGRAVTKRILERIGLAGAIDVNLMHSVADAVERALDEDVVHRAPQ